ncbi:zinc finger protein 672-like [Pollicipes pollicipes]|uniref:zinc finger protein 672-like n=1 Tax=Pollicipes pollicipes TaxID=41117 RepID=UPI001884D84E|nr:zinc finger protein 672-like [Pollicipes pollicipes]
MAAKPPRVRRLRRRVTRVRQRKLPELISLDQSTVCQVCHRDLARMSALQRHLASAHPDRTAAGEEADERPPPSTVDASAISDPRDTCAKAAVGVPETGVEVPAPAPAPALVETSQCGDLKCSECSFVAASDELLRDHQLRPHLPHVACPYCDLKFGQAAALYRHVRTAHPGLPDKPSQCHLCKYSSGRPSQVRRHLRDVHGQDDQGQPLPLDRRCPHCEFTTCSALKLRIHVRRRHTEDKQFKCSECPYSTIDKHALVKHVRIKHTDFRPFRCEICDFRTSTLSRISRHRRSHTKERPHVCAACGQSYADRRRLLEHCRRRP